MVNVCACFCVYRVGGQNTVLFVWLLLYLILFFKFDVLFLSLDKLVITGEPCYSIQSIDILLLLWQGAETRTFNTDAHGWDLDDMKYMRWPWCMVGHHHSLCCAQKMTGRSDEEMDSVLCPVIFTTKSYLCFTYCLGGSGSLVVEVWPVPLTERSWIQTSTLGLSGLPVFL